MKTSEALLYLKNNPDKIDQRLGICGNASLTIAGCNAFNKAVLKSGILFSQWEHFSGYKGFPIPAVNAKGKIASIHPNEMYLLNKGKLWSKRTKYGQLRWQLLDWLIEQFQNVGD